MNHAQKVTLECVARNIKVSEKLKMQAATDEMFQHYHTVENDLNKIYKDLKEQFNAVS